MIEYTKMLYISEIVFFIVDTYTWFNVISEDCKELSEGEGGIVKRGWLKR
jgi:hypothetical protein